MLTFSARKTLCSALIQCHFDYSCSSWYPSINKNLKDKLQVAQNKMIRFILNLKNRAHIGQKEREKAGFLNVSKRVTQLKLGHVFKISNKSCPQYLAQHFYRLNEKEERLKDILLSCPTMKKEKYLFEINIHVYFHFQVFCI